MQKRIVPILITLMCISLIGIIYIQYQWIDKAVKEKQALIDNNVHQVVQNVEEQINDQRALTFIEGEDVGFSDIGISALMGPLALGIEHHEELNIMTENDSDVKMEIQVLSSSDSISWNNSENIHHEKIEKHIIHDMDSVTVIEVQEGLGHIESVINKIKLEFHPEGGDNRIDSANIAKLMNKELSAKGLGKMKNWGVFDNKEAKYVINPEFGPHMIDYDIPLFSRDVIHPGRYDLQLSLDKSDLIWGEITEMVILAVVFLLLIILVFSYSIRLLIKHKKISQIKSDFINNMTHEFKTPLASISLAADSIIHPNNEFNKENVLKYVQIIQSEKTKLNDQVERILEVAALDKDALEINVEPMPLKEVIQKAIQKFQLNIESGKVEITQEIKDASVMANAFHLENVIVNLIDNGIKYSEGKANIDISSDENGVIRITDKGIGMNAQQLSKVFDNFYRAQSGNLHDTKGFGLGLSYCKQVIAKMGGSIDLESKPQKGTTATIKLQKA